MRSTNKLFALTGAILLVMLTFGPAAAGAVSTANGNESGNAGNADAGNAEGNFGSQVSEFVHDLMDEEIDDNETFGTLVAEFVLANNPAADKIPDHAGPPAHAGNAGQGQQGPPAHAGNAGQGQQGPPDHAGPPDDAGPSGDDDDEEADEEDNNGQGPPEGAGPPGN